MKVFCKDCKWASPSLIGDYDWACLAPEVSFVTGERILRTHQPKVFCKDKNTGKCEDFVKDDTK